MARVFYALSIKQPWATLLVHGLKVIEVRNWPTARRGPILIHAARVPDARPLGWELVPAPLQAAARQVGGIIGRGDLADCRAYRDPDSFRADCGLHRNDPSWFQPPVLYGFVFSNLQTLPFRPYSGWMRFFPVEEDGQTARRPRRAAPRPRDV